ncbi:hypothetical protein BJ980_002508 [Nocardioides daedukensis]|uniref:Uncharacterized protein n=1 Tax=Nocardioides daedukensis TaxID=634462 RepID=A0A7Y9S542_9ACTN|nr:hypothetical protein [Nocardioides daedukensis]
MGVWRRARSDDAANSTWYCVHIGYTIEEA